MFQPSLQVEWALLLIDSQESDSIWILLKSVCLVLHTALVANTLLQSMRVKPNPGIEMKVLMI